MPISTAIMTLSAGLAGSMAYLLAGGGLFWAAVIFLVAIMPEEDFTTSGQADVHH